jgi:FtsP/CotA-like multicopper oxidase with cupredoxin domain
LGVTEEWEIWNLSADAHPIHLHLVAFEVVSRREIIFDSASVDGEIEPENLDDAVGDGTYFTDTPLVQHDGSMGHGYYVVNPTSSEELIDPTTMPEYVDNYPADTVVALPGQITTIRAKFDKEGRFNWHCHILAHEGTCFTKHTQQYVWGGDCLLSLTLGCGMVWYQCHQQYDF